MASIQLCGPCNRFSIEETLQDLFSRLKNPDSTVVGGQQESPQKTWHSNLPAVFESSVKCELCKLILEGLREGRRQLVEETRFSGDWAETPKDFEDDILTIPYYSNATPNVKILAWSADSFEKENMISAIQDVENRLRAHAIIRVTCSGGVETVSSWDGYNEINCELRISSKNGGFGTHADIDPTVSEDPSSIEVINQLKFWISRCSTGHEKCNKYMHGPEILPSRLLNVGTLGSDLIHLEESGENPQTDQRYVALSHCWGTSQPFITSRENLKEHRQGILISQLPQTHQDVIRVTRALGLQYIWIDSLCIVQDDTQDWMHEAARMASVYRDAYVVIGASNASSDSEGFLGQRVIKAANVSDGLRVSLLPPGAQRLTKVSEPVKSEPLSSRAWTLQERCLPRRMISYGKDKIFWECSEMAASEDGDCIPREGDRLDLIAKTAAIEMSICKITGRSPGEITDTNYFDWYETVKGYTRRGITKPIDRLPALAGLAKALAERTGDEYLAGIWKKGLIEGLLWYGEDDLLPTSTYRAPSWSWASVDGFINFTLYNFYGRCQWKYMMANFEFTATCIESVIKPTGQDQYGSIKSGWIRLNAPLFPITSVKSWNKVSYRSPGIMMDPLRSPVCDKIIETEIRYNGKSEKLWLDGAFDVEGTNTREARLFVLLLARLPDPGSSSGYYLDIRFGLILEALGSNDEYKRVGIIDGTVKVRKASIASKLSGKLHLDPHLHKVKEIEGDDEIPNLLGPDPYEGLEQKVVKIV